MALSRKYSSPINDLPSHFLSIELGTLSIQGKVKEITPVGYTPHGEGSLFSVSIVNAVEITLREAVLACHLGTGKEEETGICQLATNVYVIDPSLIEAPTHTPVPKALNVDATVLVEFETKIKLRFEYGVFTTYADAASFLMQNKLEKVNENNPG